VVITEYLSIEIHGSNSVLKTLVGKILSLVTTWFN